MATTCLQRPPINVSLSYDKGFVNDSGRFVHEGARKFYHGCLRVGCFELVIWVPLQGGGPRRLPGWRWVTIWEYIDSIPGCTLISLEVEFGNNVIGGVGMVVVLRVEAPFLEPWTAKNNSLLRSWCDVFVNLSGLMGSLLSGGLEDAAPSLCVFVVVPRLDEFSESSPRLWTAVCA